MPRVLIIGLDGATWGLFEPWARAGKMPNLARLMSEGAWGMLRSTVPALTLPAWSSFMTGRNPGGHGIFAFRRLAPGRYDAPRLANAADLRCATLWDIAGGAGKNVGVISVPPSYPLRPVKGFIVGCMLTPPGQPLTEPPELAAELGEYDVDLPVPEALQRGGPDAPRLGLPYLEALRQQTEQRTMATLRLMRRPWDLLCVVFYAPDRIQHYYWPQLASPDGGDASELRSALAAAYAALDEAVGRLAATAGPEATLVLVSDHGFRAKPARAIYLNRWLANRGLLRERRLWRLRRLAVRALVPAHRRARHDTAEHRVDMAGTRAWAQTLDPGTAGIWVNVAARYPLGCVAEGEEYESIRAELVRELGELRDEQGARVFARVARREEVYRGPYVAEAPDVLAICEEGFGVIYQSLRRDLRPRALFGRFTELGFNGSHDALGLYLFHGAHIRPLGRHVEFPIESIAPTTLCLLDVAVPQSMDSAVCTSVLREEFLAAHPVRLTDDAGSVEPAEVAWGSDVDQGRIAERLRGLGYLE